MGLDIGSTTIKVVLVHRDQIVYQQYRRHHADIGGELAKAFDDVLSEYPDAVVQISVTGSGGRSGVSSWLDLPFVQEVIAETEAIRRFLPDTDVIIELGGEDAKITYMNPVPEQRMNGTCAGGTGAFIDQMAALLQTDAAGLDGLASRHKTLYSIASRCGVFAKSDLQPLINDGRRKRRPGGFGLSGGGQSDHCRSGLRTADSRSCCLFGRAAPFLAILEAGFSNGPLRGLG
ncbi:MAG: BadF/BadG/BcrA/BcrD ATPase family protein [Saccharofermentanales bacterium]